MKLPERLKNVYSFLQKTDILADVGCDHGYIAKFALDSGLCEQVYISDISEKSLDKAVKLLDEYMGKRSFAVCCDGLDLIPSSVSEVLIAGMGGEEIVKIIISSHFLPKTLVLQPMKNAEKVREILFQKGYGILRDTTFFDGLKFYDILVASLDGGIKNYSEKEMQFGRENVLGNPVFVDYLNDKIVRYKLRYQNGKSEEVRLKIERLVDLKNEVISNL